MATSGELPNTLVVSCFLALVFACAHAIITHAAPIDPAETYPRKPVRLIMGPPAGSTTDGLGRIFFPRLSEMWGQPVVIDNRPGAGNTIATAHAARATPDGYTLLLCPLSDAIAPSVYEKLPYDFLKDFVGIARIGTTSNVFVVHPSLPIGSIKDFIAYAKQRPGKLSYGAAGIGQAGHLSMELFKWMAGKLEVVNVPYKSTASVTGDLISGRIHAQITNLPTYLPYITSGKVRAIGVTIPKRDPRLPDVATISETLPGFDVTVWFGICTQAAVPRHIISKVNADVIHSLNSPELQMKIEKYGVDAAPSTPEQFTALLRSETARWKNVVMGAGIRSQ